MSKPWMTSQDLVESIKRKISFPISQETLTSRDLLAFANEEMTISQVPSVMIYHEEYFVYKVPVALVDNISRYPIPDRAIGMKMRDVFFQDGQGNLHEMTRTNSEDQAYWQGSASGSYSSPYKYYIEGNDIVLVPKFNTGVGSIVFSIFLRPNQLVPNGRAATCRSFVKTITVSGAITGDAITIGSKTFVAGTDFTVGVTDVATATNLAVAIQASGIGAASNGSPGTNVIQVKYLTLSTAFTSATPHLVIQTTQGIEFDNIPTTYLDPETSKTEPVFYDGAVIDFLQTKPGHKTYNYDVQLPLGGISGNIINFTAGTVPYNFIVGDYICLANECIIPQIPPDLHNGLAERACSRILASLGDQVGMQASMTKIQEIESRQGTLLDARVEGSPQKITGRKTLLRYGRRWSSGKF